MEQIIPIDSIVIGSRVRKDPGDIAALARSIKERTLLHPPVVTDGNLLVAGYRRILAAQLLGWDRIPVRVVAGLGEALALLLAERDENECREDFTPSEAVEMGRRVEMLERPKAEERQREHGGTAPGRSKNTGGKFPPVTPDQGKTRDKVGEALGMSGKTYEKARAVVEAAEEEPELFGDVAEEMDRTGKVDPAFQEVKRRKDPPPPPQFPHSDTLCAWLRNVMGQTFVVRVEQGGIKALLAEPDKWDWKEVKNYLLPMLSDLRDCIDEFHREIHHAASVAP